MFCRFVREPFETEKLLQCTTIGKVRMGFPTTQKLAKLKINKLDELLRTNKVEHDENFGAILTANLKVPKSVENINMPLELESKLIKFKMCLNILNIY